MFTITETAEMIRLEVLDLSSSSLKRCPSFNFKPNLLKELDLSNNSDLESLPKSMSELTNLQKLDVSHCGLRTFPQVITELKTLIELSVQGNVNVTCLPETLVNLTTLLRLNISRCGFECFPDVVCQLMSLEELYLRGNKLRLVSKISYVSCANQTDNLKNISDVSNHSCLKVPAYT